MRLLPFFQLHAQFQRALVIADEVVINDEDLLHPSQLQQRVQFRQHLLG